MDDMFNEAVLIPADLITSSLGRPITTRRVKDCRTETSVSSDARFLKKSDCMCVGGEEEEEEEGGEK